MSKKVIFLDTETTGTGDEDRLCQIAFKDKGDLSYEGLFKPPLAISVDAMSICHITNEMVKDKPTFKNSTAYEVLKGRFKDNNCVLVAHNAHFDMAFLKKEDLIMPIYHICTMKIAHHFDKKGELGKHTLQYLRYYYGLEFDEEINPHDAMSDVIVLEKLFDFYLQHYTVEQMIEISSKPIVLKKMMFGKYKGVLFEDLIKLDRSYMKWMNDSMDMEENLQYTVRYYLKGKHLTNEF